MGRLLFILYALIVLFVFHFRNPPMQFVKMFLLVWFLIFNTYHFYILVYNLSGIYLIFCCEMRLDLFFPYGQSVDIVSLIYKIITYLLHHNVNCQKKIKRSGRLQVWFWVPIFLPKLVFFLKPAINCVHKHWHKCHII